MRRLITIPMIMLLALFAGSCGTDAGDPLAPEAAKRIDVRIDDSETVIPREDLLLATLWTISEATRYETIKGVIDGRAGGVVRGTVPGWHEDQMFSIEFPPNSFRTHDGEPVVFDILVPSYGSQAPVFQLLPDMEFDQPVTVTLHWPSWIEHDREFSTLYCLNRSEPDSPFGIPDYWRSDIWVPYFEDGDAHTPPGQVQFTTEHFSRWVVEKGKLGPGGG